MRGATRNPYVQWGGRNWWVHVLSQQIALGVLREYYWQGNKSVTQVRENKLWKRRVIIPEAFKYVYCLPQ